MQLQSQRLLIDLDALLDTRIGLVRQHWNGNLALVDMDKYQHRIRNDLWQTFGVTEEIWREKWSERNLDTLALSGATRLYYVIPKLLGGKLAQGLLSPVHDKLQIYINIYPYQLNEDEAEDIKLSVQAKLWDECDINVVSHSPDALTPSVVKDLYDSYICYDLEHWMSFHVEAFLEKRIPTVTLYYPAAINHHNEEEFQAMMDKKIDPFDDLRQRMCEYITLEGLDTELFSLHLPH